MGLLLTPLSRMGEGGAQSASFGRVRAREMGGDRLQHSRCVFQDVVVPEAENAKALRLEIAGADRVLLNAIGMLAAVDFDDELGGEAQEVGEVSTIRHLAAELGVRKSLAKSAPQALLGLSCIATELAGASEGTGWAFDAHAINLTLPRFPWAPPSPIKGEGIY
jgi:hypothetical protein